MFVDVEGLKCYKCVSHDNTGCRQGLSPENTEIEECQRYNPICVLSVMRIQNAAGMIDEMLIVSKLK